MIIFMMQTLNSPAPKEAMSEYQYSEHNLSWNVYY